MYAQVRNVESLSPSLLRVHLTGGTLDEFEGSPATDAYINARFLPAESSLAVPFDHDDIALVAPEHRPRPRRFTIRKWDPQSQTLSIDFVSHGDDGYAGTWARRAKPGDRLQFNGPGGSYRPAPDVDWHLFAGDESALGAIGAGVESLPADARGLVFVVVDGPDHEIDLPSQADVEVLWLHRHGAENPDALLIGAVEAAVFPDGTFDVFVHGEAGEVRSVRAHLEAERGVDVGSASISPYWRRRHDDEAWRQVKSQWLTAA